VHSASAAGRRAPGVREPHDPRARLEQLHADRREAKAEPREVLERLAERHGISQKNINYAIDGYADDMLSDLFYSVERELEHESEAESLP
jgi:hypothetical protein